MNESLRAAVSDLVAKGRDGIRNPTLKDVLAVAPHLSREEAATLLQEITGTTVFIGPALLIRGAEYVYAIRRSRTSVILSFEGVYRRKESFPHQTPPTAWRPTEYDYRERVANYAELTYGHQLYWDESTQVIDHYLWYPDGKVAIATAGYRRAWAEMQMLSEGRCPLLQILDDQLTAATMAATVSAEIRGDRVAMASSNCGLCGGGLVRKTCQMCEQDYPQSHVVDWPIPLHLGLLESTGLSADRLTHDPIVAIKAHYAKWAASGTTRAVKHVRRDRVITFREDEK